MKINRKEALEKLKDHDSPFLKLFAHGTLTVEIYKPVKVDKQKPHTRDEVYVVISGTGEFFNNGNRTRFGPGDFLFVPAGVAHRFEHFSDDFSTWVLFYGPEGGEQA
ncbi:MAG: cupin domain-containing protein [Bacteroidota bacterium]